MVTGGGLGSVSGPTGPPTAEGKLILDVFRPPFFIFYYFTFILFFAGHHNFEVDDQVGFMKAASDWMGSGPEAPGKKLAFRPNCSAYRDGAIDGLREFKSKDVDAGTIKMTACTFHDCDMPTGWGTGRYPGKNKDPAEEHGFKWMQDVEQGPYLYHPNFIAGMQNKINKLKIKGLWTDPEQCPALQAR